jgi:hypothetical protein
MLESMKARESTAPDERLRFTAAPGRGGKYHGLYDYLKNRYADTVVLTFQQVEDLVGFALPELARQSVDWWCVDDRGTGEAGGMNAWTLAGRTARPNLPAKIVTFDRIS